MQIATDEGFDYRDLEMTVEERSAALFLDSIMEAAKFIPMRVFMNPDERANNPIVELAYKMYMDEKEINNE